MSETLTCLLNGTSPRRGYSTEQNLSEDEDETPILNDENTADTDGSFNSTITKSADTFKAPTHQQQKKKKT
ncbi:unnamed protein product [Timema podura]|uniref:Uncharacterized protein n=1 Tax=Timema podura TaxID=61482 RepID=A0ABN7NJF4_TIMPD|nr:unnamed protein product [Timema podura]